MNVRAEKIIMFFIAVLRSRLLKPHPQFQMKSLSSQLHYDVKFVYREATEAQIRPKSHCPVGIYHQCEH